MTRSVKKTGQYCPVPRITEICPPAKPLGEVRNLSDFFGVISGSLSDDSQIWFRDHKEEDLAAVRPPSDGSQIWFRGHSDIGWQLTPAALRLRDPEKRDCATSLLAEFRRIVEPRLKTHPTSNNESEIRFQWLQIAQHYGMPTRLLDWTTNAAIALYFACLDTDRHGAVFLLDPENLNATSIRVKNILNPVRDMHIIEKYLTLDSHTHKRGRGTVAVQPTWNNERIALQHGCFTLHGSRCFSLDSEQAPGLLHIPIEKSSKKKLQQELVRIGVEEMFIFPEPEHVSSHLKRVNALE